MVAWAPIIGGAMAAQGMMGGGRGGNNGALEAALREFSNIKQPTAAEMEIELQKYVQAGLLTPEQAQTYLMGDTEMNNINVDPSTRSAQADALRQLSDISNQGGMTAIDKSRMMAINDEMNTANRGAQQAITQNAQERGVGGSGLELAARLNAQQGAAGNAARQGVDVAAAAQQRALEAISQKANLGGQMRGQDYQQAAAKAQARDAINQFNTQNRQTVAGQNVDRLNQGQQFNLGNKQTVANLNTSGENENRTRNANLKQQVFDNSVKIAAGKSGQYANIAAADQRDADREEARRNALIGLGGTLMGGK